MDHSNVVPRTSTHFIVAPIILHMPSQTLRSATDGPEADMLQEQRQLAELVSPLTEPLHIADPVTHAASSTATPRNRKLQHQDGQLTMAAQPASPRRPMRNSVAGPEATQRSGEHAQAIDTSLCRVR